MRIDRPFFAAVFLLVSMAHPILAAETPAPEEFGAPIVGSTATSLPALLREPEKFTKTPVVLRGRLTDLCQKKGCWTVLSADGEAIRVRFQDYGFFLPPEALGREAVVEGVAQVRTLSEREARHLEAEAREGDPSRIEGPQREIGFVATGVRLTPTP